MWMEVYGLSYKPMEAIPYLSEKVRGHGNVSDITLYAVY